MSWAKCFLFFIICILLCTLTFVVHIEYGESNFCQNRCAIPVVYKSQLSLNKSKRQRDCYALCSTYACNMNWCRLAGQCSSQNFIKLYSWSKRFQLDSKFLFLFINYKYSLDTFLKKATKIKISWLLSKQKFATKFATIHFYSFLVSIDFIPLAMILIRELFFCYKTRIFITK